ncbi:MAG: PDZ domain-containing protein [Stellaceae bacterium]
MEPTQRGVVVSGIAGGSLAQRMGLHRGDIIASLDRRPVSSVTELEALLQNSEPPWTVGVTRDGKLISVTVE